MKRGRGKKGGVHWGGGIGRQVKGDKPCTTPHFALQGKPSQKWKQKWNSSQGRSHLEQGRRPDLEEPVCEYENCLRLTPQSSQSQEELGGGRTPPLGHSDPSEKPYVLSVLQYHPILTPFTHRENRPIVSWGGS